MGNQIGILQIVLVGQRKSEGECFRVITLVIVHQSNIFKCGCSANTSLPLHFFLDLHSLFVDFQCFRVVSHLGYAFIHDEELGERGEELRSLQFIQFMRKCVIWCAEIDHELHLSNHIPKQNLQNEIRSTHSKPIVDLDQLQVFVLTTFNCLFDVCEALIDLFHHRESALSSEHITDLEIKRFL